MGFAIGSHPRERSAFSALLSWGKERRTGQTLTSSVVGTPGAGSWEIGFCLGQPNNPGTLIFESLNGFVAADRSWNGAALDQDRTPSRCAAGSGVGASRFGRAVRDGGEDRRRQAGRERQGCQGEPGGGPGRSVRRPRRRIKGVRLLHSGIQARGLHRASAVRGRGPGRGRRRRGGLQSGGLHPGAARSTPANFYNAGES